MYAPERVDAALSNYFRRGNLTALRELALLLAGRSGRRRAGEVNRQENQITATGRPASASSSQSPGVRSRKRWCAGHLRIARMSSAELMIVHVARATDCPGVSAPQMGTVRSWPPASCDPAHRRRRRCAECAADFARDENATQLVLGTSRRSRWARMFDEGIGASVVQQSGPIDVHMVTPSRSTQKVVVVTDLTAPASPHVVARSCRGPSAVCALLVFLLEPFSGRGGESALFFIGVLVVALLGGVAPAALSAVLSGVLLNYFLTNPSHIHDR